MSARYPFHPILLVDDETLFLNSMTFILASEGIDSVITCNHSRDVLPMLKTREFSLVVLDLNMPGLSGKDLLPTIIQAYADIPVLVVTGDNDVETAVACMKLGAFDYILKPVDQDLILPAIRRALKFWEIHQENKSLKKGGFYGTPAHPEYFSAILTGNPSMHAIFITMEAISTSPLPILITGETGVGKELAAAAIHKLSGRSGEFIVVNIAGVDDTLFSDTLFGHTRGSFTGADRIRKGLIEQARGGTLFLDEIGDLSMTSQVKLLRLLQDNTYYPLGADQPSTADAHLIVATNQNLERLTVDGQFRKDLYYRLQAHHIHIPPLRERREDIAMLIEHYVAKAAQILHKPKPAIPKELNLLLQSYPFPGNIRELEGMIYHALSRHQSGILSLASFREKIHFGASQKNAGEKNDPELHSASFGAAMPTLAQLEDSAIREALKRASGNQAIAASTLGLSRRALNNRLRRHKKNQTDC